MNLKAKKSLELVLAEFRKGIAHHRAEGATEGRIRQILSASIRFAVQEVHDPKLCVWLCDEFSKAANLAPIVNGHSPSLTLHHWCPGKSNADKNISSRMGVIGERALVRVRYCSGPLSKEN
jgi:hypothetical protein